MVVRAVGGSRPTFPITLTLSETVSEVHCSLPRMVREKEGTAMFSISGYFAPDTISGITLKWLSALISDRYGVDDLAVARMGFEPVGEGDSAGDGYLSEIVRIWIIYDESDGKVVPDILPRSLVVKATPEGQARKLSKKLNAFAREERFYRQLANSTGVSVPRCLYGKLNPRTHNGILIFEDLGARRSGSDTNGLASADIAIALAEISKMHASYWNRTNVMAMDWLPDGEYVMAHDFRLHWQAFKERRACLLRPEHIEIGDLLQAKMQSALFVSRFRPQSMIHCDLRGANLLYGGPLGDQSVTFIDWQLVERGIPAFDFVRLAIGGREPGEGKLSDLAFQWYRGLINSGVLDYTMRECVFDIRLATAIALHIPVVFHAYFMRDGVGEELMLERMTSRYFDAAVELNLLALLEKI